MKWLQQGVTALLLAVLSTSSFAQERMDLGKRTFTDSCASCHGASGKGDGVLVKYLVKAPSDLTQLSSQNGGVFPAQRVWETIDGRTSAGPGPHGTREMPVWGNVFRAEDIQAPDSYARSRIAFVLDYLARMQEK